MRRLAKLVAGAAGLAAVVLACSSNAESAVFVFADGFTIEGQIKYIKTQIIDKGGTGQALTIPKSGEPYFIDTGASLVYFSPQQLREALEDKSKQADRIVLKANSPGKSGNSLPPAWIVESAGPWSDKWERVIALKSGKQLIKGTQRLTLLTPEFVKFESPDWLWTCCYKTEELDPGVVVQLAAIYYDKKNKNLTGEKKTEKELEDRYTIYRLLLQAGFTDEAQAQLERILRDDATQKSNIEPMLDNIRRIRAMKFVDALQAAHKAGLHDEVQRKLEQYAKLKMDDLVTQNTQLQVQEIKQQSEQGQQKVKEAIKELKSFVTIVPPSKQKIFQEIVDEILGELNADTVDRLETFAKIAGDYRRALADKRVPEQSPGEVMALALNGWMRGSNAAERDPEVSVKHWDLRQMLIKYLQTGDTLLLSQLKANIGVEEAMQLIRLLPPVMAEKIDPKTLTFDFQANGRNYHVRLPPGYHHGRSWPVLIALHHSVEKPAEAAVHWAELAGQHGYIVVAPQWSRAAKAVYQYTGEEHQCVLESLRDLRRRFNVDSDRVYLFGGEQGAAMAFDVAASHPDQFAGVIPMAGTPMYFANKYWTNTQYLPYYVINGELSGDGANYTRTLFKDFWIKSNFPSIYVEYKGRPAEWFPAEQRVIFDWMGRKRRANPLRDLGSKELEFRTQRNSDLQFYWLSADAVLPNHLNWKADYSAQRKPALLTAKVIGGVNEIQVRASGVSAVTVWFVPKLVNYGEKVNIQLNGRQTGGQKIVPSLGILLETLYRTGDRERMVFARVDLKV
jgi:pimeloyl-ACP methyl ester carboxylesterase